MSTGCGSDEENDSRISAQVIITIKLNIIITCCLLIIVVSQKSVSHIFIFVFNNRLKLFFIFFNIFDFVKTLSWLILYFVSLNKFAVIVINVPSPSNSSIQSFLPPWLSVNMRDYLFLLAQMNLHYAKKNTIIC